MDHGPKNPQQALRWIKDAALKGRAVLNTHLRQRLRDRKLQEEDVFFAIRRASSVEPYSEPPRNGGTCWRVHGKDADDHMLAVGVEAYLDEDEQAVVVCTIFETRKRRT